MNSQDIFLCVMVYIGSKIFERIARFFSGEISQDLSSNIILVKNLSGENGEFSAGVKLNS